MIVCRTEVTVLYGRAMIGCLLFGGGFLTPISYLYRKIYDMRRQISSFYGASYTRGASIGLVIYLHYCTTLVPTTKHNRRQGVCNSSKNNNGL